MRPIGAIVPAVALLALVLVSTACSWNGRFGSKSEGGADEPPCKTTQLRLSLGGEISPSSGMNPLAVRITNLGPPCTLRGYPAIFVHARHGRELPFVIARSGDQMVTDAPPVTVTLRRGAAAWIRLNNYRCDLGVRAMGRRLVIGVRTDANRLSLALHPDRPRGDFMAYCGPGDPGSILHVSPFEPTEQATSWVAGG